MVCVRVRVRTPGGPGPGPVRLVSHDDHRCGDESKTPPPSPDTEEFLTPLTPVSRSSLRVGLCVDEVIALGVSRSFICLMSDVKQSRPLVLALVCDD